MKTENEEVIKRILKPFVYEKYGKVYVGYKETEGALRVEGLIIHLDQELSTARQELIKELREKLPKPYEEPVGVERGYNKALQEVDDILKQLN